MDERRTRGLILELSKLWYGKGVDCCDVIVELLRSYGLYPSDHHDTLDGLRRRYAQRDVKLVEPADLIFGLRGQETVAVGLVVVPGHYLGHAHPDHRLIVVRPFDDLAPPASRVFANPFEEPPPEE